MAEKHYTCKQCDAGFMASRKRAFCTDKCKWRYKTLERNPGALIRIGIQECKCKGCGALYLPKEKNRNKYCSRECAFNSGATSKYVRGGMDSPRPYTKVHFKSCQHCNKSFVAKAINATCCSSECKIGFNNSRQHKRNALKKIISTTSCKNCKRLFVAEYGDKKRLFCSTDCSRSYARRVSKTKRRAIEKGRTDAESIDPFKVFDRDKWRCCLCGARTPKSKRGSYEDSAPELDHIIPLSKGGEHAYINVQCACRKCNQSKRDKELGQLLLLG